MGLITNPDQPSVLERDLTNAESHSMGDHTRCGPACISAGEDFRPNPIFDTIKDDEFEDSVTQYLAAVRKDLSLMPMSHLKMLADQFVVRYNSRTRKSDLVDAILTAVRGDV